MILLKQMIVLFIIMMAGFACRKKGIFDDHVVKKLSVMVVNIANPAMIIGSAINPGDTISGHELLITGLLSIIMFAALVLFAHFVPYILKSPKGDFGIYKCLTIFANIGFMGFPLVRSVYGPDALLYAAIFQLPFNILVYTYGVYVLCKDRPSSDGRDSVNPLREIFNIGVLSCFIALALFFIKPTVPSVIEDVCDYIGDMTPPLSMMIIGDSLSKIKIKELVKNVRLLVYSLIKLIIIPIIGTLAARFFGIDGVLLGVFAIMLAAPAATMNVLLATKYDANSEIAGEGVAITTVFSVITMPLVFLMLGL